MRAAAPVRSLAALGALLLLTGCGISPERRFPPASEAGRRACVEEVHANYPAQGRLQAMRQCLATIDQRLQEQERLRLEALHQASAPPAGTKPGVSARERFIYCRLHQSEIQAAEQERLRAQSLWAVASREKAPGSLAYDQARDAYEDALANLERLIPETMRDGQPLIPDAIRAFLTCDFAGA